MTHRLKGVSGQENVPPSVNTLEYQSESINKIFDLQPAQRQQFFKMQNVDISKKNMQDSACKNSETYQQAANSDLILPTYSECPQKPLVKKETDFGFPLLFETRSTFSWKADPLLKFFSNEEGLLDMDDKTSEFGASNYSSDPQFEADQLTVVGLLSHENEEVPKVKNEESLLKRVIDDASTSLKNVNSANKTGSEDENLSVSPKPGSQLSELWTEEFEDAAVLDFLHKVCNSNFLQVSSPSRLSLYHKFDSIVESQTQEKQVFGNTVESYKGAVPVIKLEPAKELFSEKDKSIPVANLLDISPLKPNVPKQKLYTENDMLKAIQIQDALYQERTFPKEKEITEKDQHIHILEKKNCELQVSIKTTRGMLEEVIKMANKWFIKVELESAEHYESNQKILKERNQAVEDLRNVEASFCDQHRRYQKAKNLLGNMKQTDSALRNKLESNLSQLKVQEEMFATLKNRSVKKLKDVNNEVEEIKHKGESEIAVLNARLQKAEMKYNSLENGLDQKNQEYQELCRIYDDLIATVEPKM